MAAVLPLFPKEAQYYFCKPNLGRGLDALVLQSNALNTNWLRELVLHTVNQAYKAAQNNAKSGDCIYIGGSTFVVAEILE